jgi:hypothetical protein
VVALSSDRLVFKKWCATFGQFESLTYQCRPVVRSGVTPLQRSVGVESNEITYALRNGPTVFSAKIGCAICSYRASRLDFRCDPAEYRGRILGRGSLCSRAKPSVKTIDHRGFISRFANLTAIRESAAPASRLNALVLCSFDRCFCCLTHRELVLQIAVRRKSGHSRLHLVACTIDIGISLMYHEACLKRSYA